MHYDPFSREAHLDPYPVSARLRSSDEIYRNDERDFWAVARHADVVSALRVWSTFSSAQGADIDDTSGFIGSGMRLELELELELTRFR